MSDKSLGMILATAIAAPVMIICCGGGAALIGSAVAGSVGLLSGSGVLTSALVAVIVGVALLAFGRLRAARRNAEFQIDERG